MTSSTNPQVYFALSSSSEKSLSRSYSGFLTNIHELLRHHSRHHCSSKHVIRGVFRSQAACLLLPSRPFTVGKH